MKKLVISGAISTRRSKRRQNCSKIQVYKPEGFVVLGPREFYLQEVESVKDSESEIENCRYTFRHIILEKARRINERRVVWRDPTMRRQNTLGSG